MSFIGEVCVPDQSVREVKPIQVIWEDVSNHPSNAILICRRKSLRNLHADSVDLRSKAAISGNIVLIYDIFTNFEDKKPGNYIITLVIHDVESPESKLEVNIIVSVTNVL